MPETFPPRSCPFHDDTSITEPGPMTKVTLRSGQEVWAASRHADVRTVLTDPAFSANRGDPNFPNPTGRRVRQNPKLKPSLITLDPPEHGPARRAVLGEFTVKRLAALRPRIQQIVDEHLDAMLAIESRTADLVEALAQPVPSLVICEQLGVPYEDHDFFQSRSRTLLSPLTATPDEIRTAADELRGYMDKLVSEKEPVPTDDLIGRQITKHREEGTYDHEALVSLAVLLLIAGHETTANMISVGTLALLQEPEQVALLRSDPSKTPDAVEELLRQFTIAEFVTSRVAVADTEVGGVKVQAGEGVLTLGNAANHDPEVFANPERLDVTRGARNHIAFGYGAHQCLGQNLAREELRIVFDTLFARVPTLRVDAPMSELSFKDDATIYGLRSLPVSW